MTYQNRASTFSIGVPTPRLLVVLTGCRNSMTARTLFRVSVLWWAASSCRHRWFKPWAAASSCRHRWLKPLLVSLSWYKPWFDFLLVSLTWFKPGERLSLANRWMCQYPYGKNTGVRTMVQTGGKVTCTSWVLKPWCEVQPRVATPWCEVQPLGSTPCCNHSCCYPVGGRVHA